MKHLRSLALAMLALAPMSAAQEPQSNTTITIPNIIMVVYPIPVPFLFDETWQTGTYIGIVSMDPMGGWIKTTMLSTDGLIAAYVADPAYPTTGTLVFTGDHRQCTCFVTSGNNDHWTCTNCAGMSNERCLKQHVEALEAAKKALGENPNKACSTSAPGS